MQSDAKRVLRRRQVLDATHVLVREGCIEQIQKELDLHLDKNSYSIVR